MSKVGNNKIKQKDWSTEVVPKLHQMLFQYLDYLFLFLSFDFPTPLQKRVPYQDSS